MPLRTAISIYCMEIKAVPLAMAAPITGTKTQAIVVERAGGPWTLQDVVLSELRDNELLVEMQYSGICHTVSQHLITRISLNR